MTRRLTSRNPLAYVGVEPLTPANSTQSKRNPTVDDVRNFDIGDVWINTATTEVWTLATKTSTIATWVELGNSSGVGASNFQTDSGVATVFGDTIDIVGGDLIHTDALVSNTVTISLDNGSDGEIIIGATAGSPVYGHLTSTGGSITISEGPNTLNIEADTTGFADHYPTDSGTAQPLGGDLRIIGGANIDTSGSGNTVTINTTNGTNGQLLIGGGSEAQWANLTSSDASIVITNGPNTINLEAPGGGGGTTLFHADTGSATEAGGAITIAGGDLINTVGSGSTVTANLDRGTNGQIIIAATGAASAYGNLTSTGNTISITTGAHTLNIETAGSFANQYVSDSGTAIPAGGILNVVGGGNLDTSAVGDTLSVNITNGTNGQVLIGGGSDAQWANITSSGGSITVTNGPNTINIESSTDGTNTFTTDTGTATQALNNINVVGANVISTAGASDTVTVSLDNGTNGQLLIGGGANPAWANLTSTGATVIITNGANTINLEATGIGGGASTFNTDAGAATEAAGAITIHGGELINTSGAGSTVTANLDRGTNGQLIIAATGAPSAYANLTSTGATVTITNGPNSINLEATGIGAGTTTFNTDAGAATEAAGAINIVGGSNINTVGAGQTVTVNVANSPSFSGSVTAGTGLTVTTGGITSTGTTTLSSLGNGIMRTNGSGVVSSTNGTNGQLLIGGGTNAQWANLTSSDASVVITNGANTINLQATASGATTFHTTSNIGTATVSANAITFAGSSNVLLGASGNTVTIDLADSINIANNISAGENLTVVGETLLQGLLVLTGSSTLNDGVLTLDGNIVNSSNGTNGQILIGGGTAPVWTNITSGDASVVITNGTNSIDLSVPGGGGGASKITLFPSSATWTKAAGTNMVMVIGWHGGGGGASGARGAASSGGGGGGGGAQGSAFYFMIPAIFCGATEPVVVGAGGTGGAAVSTANTLGNDGNPGTISSFGNIITLQLASGGSANTFLNFAGGQAGFLYNDANSYYTGGTNGPTAVAPMGAQATSFSVRANSGGSGSPNAAGGNGFNLGGQNLPGSFFTRYRQVLGTGGGGGGAIGFAGGTGGGFVAFDNTTVIVAGAAAGADGITPPSSGAIISGGFGGGGGNGQMGTTPAQDGGTGGFPGGGGGGGGQGSTLASGAGGDGGDGFVIVIEW